MSKLLSKFQGKPVPKNDLQIKDEKAIAEVMVKMKDAVSAMNSLMKKGLSSSEAYGDFAQKLWVQGEFINMRHLEAVGKRDTMNKSAVKNGKTVTDFSVGDHSVRGYSVKHFSNDLEEQQIEKQNGRREA